MTASPYLIKLARADSGLPRDAMTFPARRAGKSGGLWVVLILLAILLPVGVLFGAIAGIGQVMVSILLAGCGVGLLLLAKPVWMFWMLLATVLVVHGLIQFFVGFGQLQWIASALGVALLLVALFHRATAHNVQREPSTAITASAWVFLIFLSLSTAINSPSPLQVFVGLRTYLPFWGVFAIIATGVVDDKTCRRLIYALFLVAAIQWPVELYQKVFVVAERTAANYFGSAWDSIVGTFGGAKFGGGASGSLAVYVSVMAIVAMAMWRDRMMSTKWFALLSVCFLIALALSETKAVFILVPIGALVLYRAEVVRNPVRFAFGAIGLLIALSILLGVYYKLFWEQEHTRGTLMQVLETRFAYSFDPTFMPAREWPGRMTGLFIWAKHHSLFENPLQLFVGHGAGSATSFSSMIGQGDAVRRYGAGLDVTGMTKLLWEGGLLATSAFFAFFYGAFRRAKRLSQDLRIDSWWRSVYAGVQASIPMLVLAVLYEVTIVSSPPMQFLAMLLVGLLVRPQPFSESRKA